MLTVLNFRSKINTMTSAYIAQLGFKVQRTNVGTQKINGSLLVTCGMVIAFSRFLISITPWLQDL